MRTTHVGVEQLRPYGLNSRRHPAVAQPLQTPRIRRLVLVIGLTLVVAPLVLTACGDDNSSANDGDKIQVVTTLPLFADFVRSVGGDRVDVTSLLPLGADPHTFEPSPRDVEPITKADVAFANGLDLEPGLIKVLEANLPDDTELVKLAETQPSRLTNVDELAPKAVAEDPHRWLDTTQSDRYTEIITEHLADLDSASAPSYQSNSDQYRVAIADVHEYLLGRMASISPENRKLVTTHEAFDWFAGSIGFTAVAAVAESPGQEPSPNEIADLTAAIKDQHIPAVFSEPQISEESHILEQAAADAGVQVCTLYSDSLDDEVSTYIEMMRFNADELARCLGGDTDD